MDKNEKCKNCKYRGVTMTFLGDETGRVECCKNAPVTTSEGGIFGGIRHGFPRVEKDDWCGEYKPKPPKAN